jgi:predicted Zn-dependent protease
MPDFFAIMAKQAQDAPAAFLSTHPLSTAREQALRQRLAELSAKPFTPLDHGVWPPPQGLAVRNVAR